MGYLLIGIMILTVSVKAGVFDILNGIQCSLRRQLNVIIVLLRSCLIHAILCADIQLLNRIILKP